MFLERIKKSCIIKVFNKMPVLCILISVAEPKLFIFDSGSFLAPPLSIISTPAPAPASAPAPALYFHLQNEIFLGSTT